MKKSFLTAAGTALVAIAVSVFVYVNNGKNETEDLFYANVEALASDEGGSDSCDSGNCGRCFYEVKAWPFYKCNWSGVKKDYCDCDKVGWL